MYEVYSMLYHHVSGGCSSSSFNFTHLFVYLLIYLFYFISRQKAILLYRPWWFCCGTSRQLVTDTYQYRYHTYICTPIYSYYFFFFVSYLVLVCTKYRRRLHRMPHPLDRYSSAEYLILLLSIFQSATKRVASTKRYE